MKDTNYETVEEICTHCDSIVELPARLGVYLCPECKHLIINCSMCERDTCHSCHLEKSKIIKEG